MWNYANKIEKFWKSVKSTFFSEKILSYKQDKSYIKNAKVKNAKLLKN